MSTVTERLPLLELPVGQSQRSLGALEIRVGVQKTLLPLAAVEIKACVADRVASVTVSQTFYNDYKEHLEAIYIFPLSGGCVVSDFELRVGDRIVKGLVKERGQARVQYHQALEQGKRAALLEQERDDVFTMQVGNLPPGQQVTVVLTYSERLPYFDNGQSELRLPTVVADRYIPGNELSGKPVGEGTKVDTDLIADASRISPPTLVPGTDPQVALNIEVEIAQANGATIDDLSCSQHATRTSMAEGTTGVSLAKDSERLNRDFVLQWRLAGKTLKSSLVVYRVKEESYGMLSLIPPERDGYLGAARDVVFLIDRSGSMQGMKMVSAARSCSILLNTLGPKDRFAICAFDNVAEWMPGSGVFSERLAANAAFFNADESGLEIGQKFLRAIAARGGTELNVALGSALQALSARADGAGRVPVLVVLTDGQVGDEGNILKQVQNQLQATRLFTVGIDTAVNSGLLRRMANLGGGTATFVAPGTALEEALQAVGREIGDPLVTDLKVESLDKLVLDDSALTPTCIPDLFAGRATTAYVKLSGNGSVRVRGKFADGTPFDQKVKATTVKVPAIAQLWAKSHISDLEDKFRVAPSDQLKCTIIDTAVKHSLLTRFTAFVAVDESEVVNKDGTRRQIVQPVEQAEGWAMYDNFQGQPQQLELLRTSAQPGYNQGTSGFAAPGAAYGSAPRAFKNMATGDSGATDRSSWGATPNDSYGNAPAQPSMSPVRPGPPLPGTPSQQSGSGWENLPADLIGKLFGKEQPLKGQAQDKAATKQDESQRREIAALLTELAGLLEQCRQALAAGAVPDGNIQILDAAWKKLLSALGTSDVGTQLPKLQKFLRGALVELLDSLRQKNVTAVALLPLWERHLQTFATIHADTTRLLESSERSADEFWTLTI